MIACFQNKDQYFLDSANKISVFFETEALEEDGRLKVHPRVSLNKVNCFKGISLLAKSSNNFTRLQLFHDYFTLSR